MGFSLHQRKFVPLDKAKYSGLVTPRLFCDYDSSTEPSRKVELFTKGLENSFPDLEPRVNFVNKLYQCSLGQGLPLKLKKLIACGEQDSGKTSWMSILKGNR